MYYSNTQELKKRKVLIRERIIIIVICLLLTIGALIIISRSTVGALQTVQQHQVLVHKGDVRLLQPWMTVPYVSHEYHIPNHILFSALNLKDTPAAHHQTIQTIALKQKEPVNTIIHKLQQTILTYQHAHPHSPQPTRTVYRGENKYY